MKFDQRTFDALAPGARARYLIDVGIQAHECSSCRAAGQPAFYAAVDMGDDKWLILPVRPRINNRAAIKAGIRWLRDMASWLDRCPASKN